MTNHKCDLNFRVDIELEYPSVDGRIILKCILDLWDGGTDWIDLPQDRDRWCAFVNAVMNLRVS